MNEIQGDELLSLMQVTRYRFISGSRPRHDRLPLLSKAQLLPNLIPAACRVRLLLETGEWIRMTKLTRIARENKISPSCVLDFLPLAESDKALYVCLPTTTTPVQAPDEL